jgi:hypothetical protein
MTPELMQAITQGAQVGAQGLQNREQAAMGPSMGGGLPDLIKQQQEASGGLSFHPNFQHGQGTGGFFHNLGQALMALGAATTPGHAIENVVYSKQREEYSGRAKEISDLQKQQELTQQPEGALSNALYHGGQTAINQEKVDTGNRRVDAYTQHIQDQAKNYIATVNLKEAGLDERSRHAFATEIQQKANEAGRDFRALHHDATNVEVAGIITSTKEAMANEAALRDPSITGWLKNLIGIEAPQISGAPSPTMGGPAAPSTPKASKPAGAAPKRPSGVPADAKWDSKTNTWYK